MSCYPYSIRLRECLNPPFLLQARCYPSCSFRSLLFIAFSAGHTICCLYFEYLITLCFWACISTGLWRLLAFHWFFHTPARIRRKEKKSKWYFPSLFMLAAYSPSPLLLLPNLKLLTSACVTTLRSSRGLVNAKHSSLLNWRPSRRKSWKKLKFIPLP